MQKTKRSVKNTRRLSGSCQETGFKPHLFSRKKPLKVSPGLPVKNYRSVFEHGKDRHHYGFAKHKGEILKRTPSAILFEVLEELADAHNYLHYYEKKTHQKFVHTKQQINTLYLKINAIKHLEDVKL